MSDARGSSPDPEWERIKAETDENLARLTQTLDPSMEKNGVLEESHRDDPPEVEAQPGFAWFQVTVEVADAHTFWVQAVDKDAAEEWGEQEADEILSAKEYSAWAKEEPDSRRWPPIGDENPPVVPLLPGQEQMAI